MPSSDKVCTPDPNMTFEQLMEMGQMVYKSILELREENARRQEEIAKINREAAELKERNERENSERQQKIAEQDEKRKQEMAEQDEKRKQEMAQAKAEEEKRGQKLDRRLEKTERMIKRNGRQMGDLHNKFGKLAEHLVVPGIAKRFNELGFHFDDIAPHGRKILDEQGKIKAEIDALLENGEYAVAVEIKTQPKVTDIAHHERRLEILREHRNKRHDDRKIYGAIAGAIFEPEVKKATLDAGMYVLEQSGDTMKLEKPDDFVPRVW
jgi:hypothetical protein